MKNYSQKAFTIIEILVSIFILEVGILAIGSFFTFGYKITKNARTETIASNLGAGLLDETLANSFDNISVETGVRERYSLEQDDPFFNYDKRIDANYIDATLANSTSPTQMKKITVTIYWNISGQEKTYQIVAVKASH